VIREVVPKVIQTDPRDLGYAQTVWTAELLRNHIEKSHGAQVRLRSIQTTLRELNLRWKRPRHTLARRAPDLNPKPVPVEMFVHPWLRVENLN
jgi:transposase